MTTTRTICPFLVPVTADLFWMLPPGVYCCRPGHVRMPARSTLLKLCGSRAYVMCAGYQASRACLPKIARKRPA